ncbi:MAG: hypothetical protein SVG88_00560 [Halobacteriales archaeon]|nr:hypothetical protein [Halobacteriales archaeon]
MNWRLALALLLAALGTGIAYLPEVIPLQNNPFLYAGTIIYIIAVGIAVLDIDQVRSRIQQFVSTL